jgi:predicted aspartyl protease
MKKIMIRLISVVTLVSASTLPTAGLFLLSRAAQAQQGSSGLMVNSSGKTQDLYAQFSRGGRDSAAPNQAPKGKPKVFQTKIKRRDGGTPVIDVVFNGNKTFEMILDTGASGTLITKKMAAVLGVRVVGKVKAGIANGSVVEFDLGRVQSIGVGGAVVKNVNVAIAPKMDIGLLGHDFFGNYDVKIKKDLVEFYPRWGIAKLRGLRRDGLDWDFRLRFWHQQLQSCSGWPQWYDVWGMTIAKR